MTGTWSTRPARRSAAWLRSSPRACAASTRPPIRPHVDTGDHIVVINAEKIRVTGRKLTDKIYHHHTGYLGNLKTTSLEKLLDKHPERAIEFAVKGMLPKNPLGRKMFKKLHVFAGAEHPHTAQQPKALEI